MSDAIGEILFDEVLTQPVAFEEGADPYAVIPLPPEPGPETFRIARQGPAHVRIRWTVKNADAAEKSLTARGNVEFHKLIKEVYSLEDESEVEATARRIIGDENTKRCLSINLVLFCFSPGHLWDGSISYCEMTSEIRKGAKVSPLSYLASRLSCPMESLSGANLLKFLDSTIPEGSAEESPIEIKFRYRWSGYGRDSKGKYINVRGMNRWPIDKETKLHKQELDHKDATEPIKASLEIVGYE